MMAFMTRQQNLEYQLEERSKALCKAELESLRHEVAENERRRAEAAHVDPAVAAAEALDRQVQKDLSDKDYVECLRREAWINQPGVQAAAWKNRHRENWIEELIPESGWPDGLSAEKAVRKVAKELPSVIAAATRKANGTKPPPVGDEIAKALDRLLRPGGK